MFTLYKKINKIEYSGNIGELEGVLGITTYTNFITKFSLNKKIDYNFLREILNKEPDLYVEDIC